FETRVRVEQHRDQGHGGGEQGGTEISTVRVGWHRGPRLRYRQATLAPKFGNECELSRRGYGTDKPISVKITAPGAFDSEVDVRLPQRVRDQVGDAFGSLDATVDAEDRRGSGQDRVLLEHLPPQHQVDEAGLVLEGAEGDAAGGPRL